MEDIYSRFKVSPTKTNKYILIEDFEYRGYIYPRLYITNGGNIPRLFWSIILPFAPRLLPAYLVHDYWCDRGEYKKADRLFQKILKDLGVSRWKRVVMVRAVKLYHEVRY